MNRNILAAMCAALSWVGTSSHAFEIDKNTPWYVVPQVGAIIPDETTQGWFAGLKVGKHPFYCKQGRAFFHIFHFGGNYNIADACKTCMFRYN